MNYAVSVIVPVYQVEAYIERSARALFEQSLLDLEFIFIDDRGSDNSMQILKEVMMDYPDRMPHIQLLVNEYNSGSSVSRNRGLDIAKGTYIAFCDSDDWMDQLALKQMYNCAKMGNHDLIWTDFYLNFSDREILQKQYVTADKDSCIRAMLIEKMHGSLWNKLYKRILFEEHKIRFNESANVWEDLCANIQLFFFAARIAYLPKAYYHYQQERATSLTGSVTARALEDVKANVAVIATFLEDRTGLLYEKELFIAKLASKQILLSGMDMAAFRTWKITYPESNSYIIQFSKLPIHLRILGWCASNNLWIVIRTWLFLMKFNKMKRNILTNNI